MILYLYGAEAYSSESIREKSGGSDLAKDYLDDGYINRIPGYRGFFFTKPPIKISLLSLFIEYNQIVTLLQKKSGITFIKHLDFSTYGGTIRTLVRYNLLTYIF